MHVIALTSYKGGVGKSTVSLNLAYSLAARGWRTLVVDADPQGSIGCSLRRDVAQAAGLADCLRGESGLDEVVVSTRLAELKLLPFGRASAEEASVWCTDEQARAFKTLLNTECLEHDVVIVDTPGGGAAGSAGTVAAADSLLLLVQAEPLAARAVPRFLEFAQRLRHNGYGPKLAGVLLTMVQTRLSTSLTVVQEVFSLFPATLTLEAFVPRDPAFLDASAKGVPVRLLRRDPPPVAAVFDQVAAELEQRIGLVAQHAEVDDEPVPLLD